MSIDSSAAFHPDSRIPSRVAVSLRTSGRLFAVAHVVPIRQVGCLWRNRATSPAMGWSGGSAPGGCDGVVTAYCSKQGGVPEGVGRCRRWRAALCLTDYPTVLGSALPGSARRGIRVPRSAVLTLAV